MNNRFETHIPTESTVRRARTRKVTCQVQGWHGRNARQPRLKDMAPLPSRLRLHRRWCTGVSRYRRRQLSLCDRGFPPQEWTFNGSRNLVVSMVASFVTDIRISTYFMSRCLESLNLE